MPGRPPNKAASGTAGAKSGTGRAGGYTMAEVARIAGVSAMTVSRALKHDGSVSPETRSKILKVIKRTGYVIDLTARSFGSGKSGFVAVLIPSLNNSNFADTVSGISAVFEGSGLQLLLGSTEYELEREEHLIDTMLQRRPEALIIAGTVHTPRTAELLQNAPFPVVEIWELPPAPLQHVVGFSNAEASAAMVRHLHAKGYRHIGFIGGATFRDYRGGARRRGYRETLKELGLPEGPDLTFGHSPINTEEAALAVAQDDRTMAAGRRGDVRRRSVGVRRADGMPSPRLEGARPAGDRRLRQFRDQPPHLAAHHHARRRLRRHRPPGRRTRAAGARRPRPRRGLPGGNRDHRLPRHRARDDMMAANPVCRLRLRATRIRLE